MPHPGAVPRLGRRPGRAALALALGALVALLGAAPASAHGLVGRANLPVPPWLFAWAAAAVLVISFVALGRLWSEPRLTPARRRRLGPLPAPVRAAAGAVGLAWFALVVASGLLGNQAPLANLAPTAVFVLFWIGVPLLSALFGDVFSLLSPWRALARLIGWLSARVRGSASGRSSPLPYPERLGRWPAAAGIVAFGWLELVFPGHQRPATLAVLAVAYALVQLVGMAWYGERVWSEHADAFGVAFGLFGRLAPVELRADGVFLRAPLSGLAEVEALPGTVAVAVALIGTTTFDGLLNGFVWRAVGPPLRDGFVALGLSGSAPLAAAQTVGLAVVLALCMGLYWLGVRGMSATVGGAGARGLGRAFAPTLIPIGFGYLLAHYFSLLATQGQATAYLISDPLGQGSNLFGTAHLTIDAGLLSAATIWYVQVAALLCGHVGGLALAHDRALTRFGHTRAAVDSQRWMLVVMVTFTCLGLWLLSAIGT